MTTTTKACGGCGATKSSERCIGCTHDFGDDASAWVRPSDKAAGERDPGSYDIRSTLETITLLCEGNGEPCDGFRFRELILKARALLSASHDADQNLQEYAAKNNLTIPESINQITSENESSTLSGLQWFADSVLCGIERSAAPTTVRSDQATGEPTNLEKLVADFSAALLAKLQAAEKKYGYSDNWMREGWMDECRAELMRHIAKGDPRDVAAYCAFLWHHGEKTSTAPTTGSAPIAFDMLAHLARQAAWSELTFGPGARTKGVVDHIRKELREIEADPTDLTEWIDVVILALDGAWRAGGSPEQIIRTIVAKQTKNEGRAWPDWRTADPDKAIEHDRSQDAAPHANAPVASALTDEQLSEIDTAACEWTDDWAERQETTPTKQACNAMFIRRVIALLAASMGGDRI